MNCPICDKPFDSNDQLIVHLEFHKTQSFLNSTPESSQNFTEKPTKHEILIDVEKFFGKKRFEGLIIKKLKSIDDEEELVNRRNFVEQVKKIVSKHPFVYLPYFIDDLFHGKDSAELLEKYSIHYHMDLKNIVQNTLKFERPRYRQKKYENAFEMNKNISTWGEKYDILKNNCNFFKEELLELIFFNTLRSYLIIMITDYVEIGISVNDIYSKLKELKNNYNIFRFIDKQLSESFEQFFNLNFDDLTKNILDELIQVRVLKRKTNNHELLVGRMSIDKIKQSVIHELKYQDGSQIESALRIIVTEKYPSLKLIPGLKIWETALDELSDEKMVHLESKSNSRNSNMVFLNKNYEKIRQSLRRFDNIPVEFYGRTISPENYIYELTELEKGDFDDQDDQVTRIAGLILAESVKLQSIHEKIEQFDFSINITDYNFRPEQLDAMKKLNFKINSNIFHCKVMLNDILNLEKYTEIKNVLPENEQGIVFTFKKIDDNVIGILDFDKSIQTIDEEGLKIWVSITSTIPSRKNSITKLHFDPISKLEKKIVLINTINYVDGLASVSVFPEMNEVTVLVRSLEEIPLFESHPSDLNLFSKNYSEFLRILFTLTTNTNCIDGFFKNQFSDKDIGSKSEFELKFDHNTVKLNLNGYEKRDIFNCDCLHYADNSLKLCSHLISALDYVFRMFSFVDQTWNDGNSMRNALKIFIEDNIGIILERLEIIDSNGESETDPRIRDFVLGVSKIRKKS